MSTRLSETRTDLQLNPSMCLPSFIKAILWGIMYPGDPAEQSFITVSLWRDVLRNLKHFSNTVVDCRMLMGTDKTPPYRQNY